MDYGMLVGAALALLALVVFAGLQLLRQVTRACMPHPVLSDGEAYPSPWSGREEAGIPALDARTQGVNARDGLLTGLGILFGTALGLWHHPAWLAVSLAYGAYLVLTAFKKAPVEMKVSSRQSAVGSRQQAAGSRQQAAGSRQ